MKAQTYLDAIKELMRALRTAAIPVIVLKGAALADTIYPSIASRPMNDIDLLVAWLFFPGPGWLAERYRLPGRLRPYLACVWHPDVVLAQGAAAAWALATARR